MDVRGVTVMGYEAALAPGAGAAPLLGRPAFAGAPQLRRAAGRPAGGRAPSVTDPPPLPKEALPRIPPPAGSEAAAAQKRVQPRRG